MSFFATLWSYVDVYTVSVLVGVWWLTQYLMWKGYLFNKGRNVPYGIYGVPIFGIMPYFYFRKTTFFESVSDEAKRHGPVIRLRAGGDSMYFVTGATTVREGMLSDDLLGRPKQAIQDDELAKAFNFDSIINLEGDLWRKHRRFSLMTLRDMGFGKTPRMEASIQEELRELVEIIDKKNGEAFDVQDLLVPSTSNNISTLVFGERLPFEHPKRKELNRLLTAFNEDVEKLIFLSSIPYVSKLLHKLKIGPTVKLVGIFKGFRQLVESEIENHKKELDRNNLRDYIDHYIVEQEKDKDFSDELMVGNTMAFFQAGSATVRVTVEYLLHLMAHMPEVQRKVQAEIDEVTGGNREVTWADSAEMVYTMAVIAERHRYYSITPTGVPRRTLKDTKLGGYDIPAKAQVLFDIDSVNYDPEIYKDPYEFRPERFIEDGKIANTEKLWSFSIGKRACPGESLAVLEVFLYFAIILQNFTVLPEGDGPVKFKPLRGLIAEVARQKVRFVKRQ